MPRRFQRTLLVALLVLPYIVLAVDGWFGFRLTWWLFGDAIEFVKERVLSPLGL